MTAVLDKSLVTHCAPTLASLKTGSLFTVLHLPEESLCQQIDHWNFRLKGKGVYLTVLRRGRNGTLLYVFRPQRLTADLAAAAAEGYTALHDALHGVTFAALGRKKRGP